MTGRWLLIAVLATACSDNESEREEAALKSAIPERLQADGSIKLSDADRAALGLATEPVELAELAENTVRYGRVVTPPGKEGLVVAPVTGQLPRAPFVQLGQSVKAGEPLLEIVPSLGAAERVTIGAGTAQLAGQIKATEGDLTKKEADLARARELAASSIVSQQKLQEAETAVATTKAQLEGLRRARAAQGGGRMTLRAPVDGVVVTLIAAVGAGVSQGDVIARVLQPGPQLVDVAVAPSEPAGRAYEVRVGDEWLGAHLVAEGGEVQDGARRDRIAIDATKPVRLLPGETVPVRVARRAANGLIVPDDALVSVPGGDVVYVETSPNVFAARRVEVAARFGGRARLSAGVKQGEKVVNKGAIGLRGESLRAELRHVE